MAPARGRGVGEAVAAHARPARWTDGPARSRSNRTMWRSPVADHEQKHAPTTNRSTLPVPRPNLAADSQTDGDRDDPLIEKARYRSTAVERARWRGPGLPLLRRCLARHRRGGERVARRYPDAVQGAGGAPAQARLPRLRGRCGAGTRPRAADRGRHPDRAAGRAWWPASARTTSRSTVRRRSMPAGDHLKSLDAGRLDWPGGLHPRAAAGAAARAAEGLDQAARRRDHRPGARSRPGQDQERAALGLRP